MRQGVEAEQRMALGVEGKLADGRVAYAQIQFHEGLRRSTQNLRHGGGNRAAAADQQHVAAVLAAHMVQRSTDTGDKGGIARHTGRMEFALGPLQQGLAQPPEMFAVALGRFGLGMGAGVQAVNQRVAVVLV